MGRCKSGDRAHMQEVPLGPLERAGREVSLGQSTTHHQSMVCTQGHTPGQAALPAQRRDNSQGCTSQPGTLSSAQGAGGSRTSHKLAFSPDGKMPALVLGKIYRPVATMHPILVRRPPQSAGSINPSRRHTTHVRCSSAAIAGHSRCRQKPLWAATPAGRNSRGQERSHGGLLFSPRLRRRLATSPDYTLQ